LEGAYPDFATILASIQFIEAIIFTTCKIGASGLGRCFPMEAANPRYILIMQLFSK
jgi:hypothetical protein